MIEPGTSQGGFPRRVFKGWEGDVESSDRRLSLQMDGPKSLQAEWSTDYTMVYGMGAFVIAIVVLAVFLVGRR